MARRDRSRSDHRDSEGLGSDHPGSERSGSDRGSGAVAVALAVVLVLSGCAGALPGVAGDDAGDGPTVNPALAGTPTPEATPAGGYPVGVAADGTVDAERLVAAHRDALATGAAANGSWTVTLTRRIAGPDGTIERASARVRVNGSDRLYTVERVRGDARLRSVRWSNGTASASRTVDWDGNASLVGRPADGDGRRGLDTTGGDWLTAVLRGLDATYVATESTPNGSVAVVEASAGRVEQFGSPDRRQVRLTARVADSGLVRSVTLRYRISLGNEGAVERVTVATTRLGATTVPRPDWVDRALATATATATPTDNETATATPTDNETATATPSAPRLPPSTRGADLSGGRP
ncbi:hypothetical protein Hbl1158_12875 [Halobaculum sp. CBA1158]|uniref:hypothetical protein n=1 Tax=Halobaculum sp. CBA1158 TaxID=2904243 RepID=UPI001F2D13FD|nr:hypothetical protein [Halobaculum sp. CBA1158]UIO99408.1 hypothetical protein Hbl1158_12875 [Halobaculum sp. CBA1158]